MKNERILIADDSETTLDFEIEAIELLGKKDGHKIIGKASSVKEVKKLMRKGLKPTVAIVDNDFPKPGDGEEAADVIKKFSKKTFIVSFSGIKRRWGQENWVKPMTPEEFTKAITKLKH